MTVRIPVTEIAALLGVFGPHKQLHSLRYAVKKKHTLEEEPSFFDSPLYQSQQQHLQQCDLLTKWPKIKQAAQECDNYTKLQRFRQEVWQLLFSQVQEDNQVALSLFQHVIKIANKQIGICGEKLFIARHNQVHDPQSQIKKNNLMHQKKATDDCIIYGKIDGLLRGTVIEIKHRTEHFIHPLPLHEKIQLHAYMWLLGKDVGYLVQCVQSPTDSYSQLQEVPFEPEFWQEILHQLKAYLVFFHQLTSSSLALECFFKLTKEDQAEIMHHKINLQTQKREE